MIASDKVQEIAYELQQLNSEEKRQLFMLVPSLWESIPVENLLTLLSQEEEAIRHGTEYGSVSDLFILKYLTQIPLLLKYLTQRR